MIVLMHECGGWVVANAEPRLTHAVGNLEILAVHERLLTKPSQRMKVLGTDKQRSAAEPPDIASRAMRPVTRHKMGPHAISDDVVESRADYQRVDDRRNLRRRPLQ